MPTGSFQFLSFRRRRRVLPLVGLLTFALLVGSGCDSNDPGGGNGQLTVWNVVQQLSSLTDTNKFRTLVADVGLDEDLKNKEAQFTVFVTNEDGLDPYNVDSLRAAQREGVSNHLRQILQHHIVKGEALAPEDIPTDGEATLTSEYGDEISLQRSGQGEPRTVTVEGARAVMTRQDADNGVVYVIDDLILTNRSMFDRMFFTDDLDNFHEAIKLAGRESVFQDASTEWTVFVPDDVDELNLSRRFSTSELSDILRYHAVEGIIDSTALADRLIENNDATTQTSVQGEELRFQREPPATRFVSHSLFVNEKALGMDALNQRANNGMIHLIEPQQGSGTLIPPSFPSVADLLADQSELSTFTQDVTDTGFLDTLGVETNPQGFTVFATANEAFEDYDTNFLRADSERLRDVLEYHVVPEEAIPRGQLHPPTDNRSEQILTTFQGESLFVQRTADGTIHVGRGTVSSSTDLSGSNGVVHVVDDLLLGSRPRGEQLNLADLTESFYEELDNAGLVDAANDLDNQWTTFAPNNAAIENADLSGYSAEERAQIVQYHTIERVDDVGLIREAIANSGGSISFTTRQGEDITLSEEGNDIVINGGEATIDLENADWRSVNGVLHVIDGVLIPDSVQN